MLDLKLRKKPDVRYRVVGEEAVIIRQDAAEVLALNDVGARVLELIDDEPSLERVVQMLLDEYDVERGELEPDVAQFVASLQEAGVLERA